MDNQAPARNDEITEIRFPQTPTLLELDYAAMGRRLLNLRLVAPSFNSDLSDWIGSQRELYYLEIRCRIWSVRRAKQLSHRKPEVLPNLQYLDVQIQEGRAHDVRVWAEEIRFVEQLRLNGSLTSIDLAGERGESCAAFAIGPYSRDINSVVRFKDGDLILAEDGKVVQTLEFTSTRTFENIDKPKAISLREWSQWVSREKACTLVTLEKAAGKEWFQVFQNPDLDPTLR